MRYLFKSPSGEVRMLQTNVMPYTIWITGVQATGKTTLAKWIIKNADHPVVHLDGDDMRKSISSDLSFSPEDTTQHILRVARLAKVLNDQGFSVVVSMVSRNRDDRLQARRIIGYSQYQELHTVCDKKIMDEVRAAQRRGMPVLYDDYELSTAYYVPDIDISTISDIGVKIEGD